jgi:hypothetical protein
MTQVLEKITVSKTLNKDDVKVNAKVLSGLDAKIGFYEAALLKAKSSAAAKAARSDKRITDSELEETTADLTQAEVEALRAEGAGAGALAYDLTQAEVEALRSEGAGAGALANDAGPVLLASNHTQAVAPTATTAMPAAHDGLGGFPWKYVVPAFATGALVSRRDDNEVPAPAPIPEDNDEINFTFPSRPTGVKVKTLSVAALDIEVQSFGDALDDALELAEGESLVVDLGTKSQLKGATTSDGFSGGSGFLVTASGNVGDLHINLGNKAYTQLVVDVSGGVGDIAMRTGKDTESGPSRVYVSAGGDVGHVTRFADGADAGGFLYIDTTGGDVAQVDLLFANPDGNGSAFVSAFAAVSGLSLVGGNVGDVSLAIEGVKSEGRLYVYASGGNVGDVEKIVTGGSASGKIDVSAFAQIDGNGLAVGGNIGDVTVVGHGDNADADLDAYAYGVLSSSGQYLGGGNIGNVNVSVDGGRAESDVNLRAFSGGSVGSITIQTSSPGEEVYSASANVYAYVYGAGGQVATIGDVTIDVHGGTDNSGWAQLYAYSGGDIGTINATFTGGASGHIDINAAAHVNASGSGGNIGAVTLTDTSWAGSQYIRLEAGTSIGDVTASLGGGSATIDMTVKTGADAVVGNISVAFDDEHYDGRGSNVTLIMDSGTTGGDTSVTGGSISSQFTIRGSGKVAGDIDMSSFAGYSEIKLDMVVDGVSIDVGQGGSSVIGSLGADTITLGAGSDQLITFNTDVNYLPTLGDTDTVIGFDADRADETDDIDLFNLQSWSEGFVELTSDVATSLTNNDVLSLVDLFGGEDLSTTEGLLEALNGGEYGSVDGVAGEFTFVTATGTTAASFNLFHVEHDGTEFTNAYLLADVIMATGSTFADLSADNFTVS